MKRGCLDNTLFAFLVLIAFGGSSYVWFTFFVRGKTLSTPNLIGETIDRARATCSDLGVGLVIDDKQQRNSDKVPTGRIVWQNREPGTTKLIKRGTTLRVGVSLGPLVLKVPDLAGQSPGTAVLRLGQQNLKLGTLTYFDNRAAQGILAADPPKDTVVGAQTAVSLLIGTPPAQQAYVMPDLIDHPLDRVRPYLEIKGLKIATVKFETYPGIPDGIIIRQYPLRGAPVSGRDSISVVVSRAEETGIIDKGR